MFDPLDIGKYRWLEYLRTPIQQRERNIILAAATSKESDPPVNGVELDATRIREILAELDTLLTGKGIEAKLSSSVAAQWHWPTTRDVVLDAAPEITATYRLPNHWPSDGVMQLMSLHGDDHPRSEKIGRALTIEIASPRYPLAMKVMSSRKSQGDLDDAAVLCSKLGIAKESGIEEVVACHFGRSAVGAQELFFERIIERAGGV